MKTTTLSNWERVWLAVIVGSGQGTIAQIRLGNKALDVLEMTDEEKAEIGWQALSPNQAGWQREREWELSFEDDVWLIIQGYAKSFQRWPQDRRAEALYDKVLAKEDQ